MARVVADGSRVNMALFPNSTHIREILTNCQGRGRRIISWTDIKRQDAGESSAASRLSRAWQMVVLSPFMAVITRSPRVQKLRRVTEAVGVPGRGVGLASRGVV
jgi:hypothetical protein